jgi:Leucine-rich repeat (LRR) protein
MRADSKGGDGVIQPTRLRLMYPFLSPLTGLINLKELDLYDNDINGLSPLAGLIVIYSSTVIFTSKAPKKVDTCGYV